ncbi:MAG: asparagine synthase (glutamine-hydrolyzing) [Thermodesulfobacteriota bacterium]
MCGICGIVYTDQQRLPAMEMLQAMARALRFRGPDAEGYFLEPGVGLAHRRLSVIDLARGGQPMTDPAGRVTVVYNGEIYNFLALREELSAQGYQFRTTSDTEVLLSGYLQWGVEVLPRLVGMYAFAVWDARDHSLLLARDRLGVKPLYWGQVPGGGVIFASELSSIIASRAVPLRLEAKALARYMALGYLAGRESALQGVERLAPGAYLHWQPGGPMEPKAYWDLAAIWASKPKDTRAPREIEAEFLERLDLAVRQRLMSDVPLGAFLSGGIDSSIVTALMRRHLERVDTFSIGFSEESYDERSWASLVAQHLGTKHHAEVIRADSPDLLLEISSRLDEPFADTSIIPTYFLCKMARPFITVALSGDGGDELLAGYPTQLASAIHRRMQWVPRSLWRRARRFLDFLPESRRKVNLLFKLKQFLAGAALPPQEAHAAWRLLAFPEKTQELLLPELPLEEIDPFGPFREAFHQAQGLGPLDRLLCLDYKTWLPDDILVKVDRASMSHGLEVRSPFLDHRLLEFCAGMPEGLKLQGRRGKYILRRVAGNLVPPQVITRKKEGFNAPVSHWLAGSWRHLAEEAFSPASLHRGGLLNPGAVNRLFQEHLQGRRDHGFLLFSLLMLVLWLQKVRPEVP